MEYQTAFNNQSGNLTKEEMEDWTVRSKQSHTNCRLLTMLPMVKSNMIGNIKLNYMGLEEKKPMNLL